jgi:3-oxoacyl-[acyl-carrier-protein] synthase III
MSVFSVIKGIGGYLPSNIVTNDELSKSLDTSDLWIRARTGILQRNIASSHENTADFARNAANDALSDSNKDPKDIELIILATSTPDNTFPATAAKVQNSIGAINAVAFDVNAACSGFLFALEIANNFLKQGTYKNAIVIGCDTNSRIVDWTDRSTAILFGDGAGAVVLDGVNCDDEIGVLKSCLYTDGSKYDYLYVDGGVSTTQTSGVIKMKGREVFRFAVQHLERLSREIFYDTDYSIADIDWLVPHQANTRIIEAVAKKLEIPSDKVINTTSFHANTSAASIPLALLYGKKEKNIKIGDLILLQAFGAGFTGASILVRF